MTEHTRVVLITGASSGIGAAGARRLAADGHRVVLGARRTDRLEHLVKEIHAAGGTAMFRSLDVTDAADVHAFVAAARAAYGRVDVLVNNAGIMPLSRLDAGRTDEWDRMIDVNLRGVLHGIAAVLPVMREQGGGHVVNIASVGAYEVSPTAVVYCATKFAVRALSEGLRQESDGSVRVTVVSPGVTDSELVDHLADPEARALMRTYRAVSLPAETIADAIAYAVAQPPEVDVNEIVVRPAAGAQ
ncbi:SDR family oxidoreductase [Streptomyces olivochromogenes]|uniref:SDR family oxidoreductase n=1 Tax=Streptomyces olivochromogenes TaxID=1963 RepID=UPI001F310D1C|nr:SDR family oxidoreductase [Streptomyces olivochromogenes]MCF3130348.1 SDR family oxidoreductase [Streptomyces olivochromogenes]